MPCAAVRGCCLRCASCGYHTSGKAVRLPQNVRSIYVPTFTNNTHAFRVEQVLTAAVVQELRSRTNFQVVLSDNEPADATLNGTVTVRCDHSVDLRFADRQGVVFHAANRDEGFAGRSQRQSAVGESRTIFIARSMSCRRMPPASSKRNRRHCSGWRMTSPGRW